MENIIDVIKKMQIEIPKDIISKKCFCDSGNKMIDCCLKKFKNSKKIDLVQIIEDYNIFDLNFENQCLIFEENKHECNSPPVGSHTISHSINLKKIMKDNKVYNIAGGSFYEEAREQGQSFKKIATTVSSIFPGFCNKHEQLFLGVDKGISNKDDILKSYYREVIFQTEKLKRGVKRAKFLKKMCNKLKSRMVYLEKRNMLISLYHGYTEEEQLESLRLLISERNRDEIIDNFNNSEDFIYFKEYEYEGVLPFVASSIYALPTYRLNENPMHVIVSQNRKGNSSIILACFKAASQSISEIERITENKENIADIIFKLSFSMENSFYNIDYIDKDKEIKNKLKERYNYDTMIRMGNMCVRRPLLFKEYLQEILIPFDFIKIENKLISNREF